MPSHLFVVSGCGRSGTAFTASVLTALGAPCGQGAVFHDATDGRGPRFEWPAGAAGDATWAAAPALGKLPDGAAVLHQVRDPLEVVRSLVRMDFFGRPSVELAYAQKHVPELALGGRRVRALRFWLEWNRMIEAAADYDDLRYRRHRVEDLDVAGVRGLCDFLGLERPDATIERVLAAQPRDRGTRGDRRLDARITWDSLPSGVLLDEVVELAQRYGYATDGARRLRAG